MKKLLLFFTFSLLGLSFYNISANATNLKMVIDNETDQDIKINKVVNRYSIVSEEYEPEDFSLKPKERKSLEVYIASSMLFDLIKKGDLENDGVYFNIGGKNLPIVWGLRPNTTVPVFEPLISDIRDEKYQFSKKINKGGTFYISIENKNLQLEID